MTDEVCIVCGGVLAADRATCHECGAEFHLALRTDSQTPDCGDVWIDDDAQALAFACNTCLGHVAEPPKRRYTRREGTGANIVARSRRAGGGRTKRLGDS